ncbi:MAG: hypothetical protein JW910_22415, partial [Anaerolineae bacterium]|nr:hypothetical protein [Anaerolineae bacterium]
ILETRPRFVTEALQQSGPFGGGALPNNFWLCDLRLGMLQLLAAQPQDASFAVAGVSDRFVVRGNPYFSPDGAFIAWMEDRTGTDDPALVIHSLASAEANTSQPDLPDLCCVPRPWPLFWGASGLWLYGTVFEDTVENSRAVLLRVSETGDVLQEIALASEPTTVLAALNGEVEAIVLLYSGTNPPYFLLVDPGAGEVYGITPGTQGYLELYNPLDPHGVSLIAVPDQGQIAWVVMAAWQRQYGEHGESLIFHTRGLLSGARQFAPGPQGQLLLWQGRILYWGPGGYLNPAALEQPAREGDVALFWGPRAWRITRPRDPIVLADISPDAITCEGFIVSRLQPYAYGRVIDSTANNLRETPTITGALIGQIPPGGEFYVWEGPVCADGFAWWQVGYQGLTGWMVEGQGDTYWLAPGD